MNVCFQVNLRKNTLARKTKEEAQKTKKAILDAAVAIFVEKGVANASLEEIAQAAGVSRGAVYWHFQNKMEIFDALHQRLYCPVAEMILQDLEKDYPRPLEQLEELCTRFLLDLETNLQQRQALTLFLIKCDYSGELAANLERHEARKAENLRLLSQYFEKARKKGFLPPDADPETLTLSISCYMKGIIVEYLNNPKGWNLGIQGPKLIKLFFRAFGAGNSLA